MSKIGNARIEMQETDDYRFGWESAERGEPQPCFACYNQRDLDCLRLQSLGWDDFHNQEQSK